MLKQALLSMLRSTRGDLSLAGPVVAAIERTSDDASMIAEAIRIAPAGVSRDEVVDVYHRIMAAFARRRWDGVVPHPGRESVAVPAPSLTWVGRGRDPDPRQELEAVLSFNAPLPGLILRAYSVHMVRGREVALYVDHMKVAQGWSLELDDDRKSLSDLARQFGVDPNRLAPIDIKGRHYLVFATPAQKEYA